MIDLCDAVLHVKVSLAVFEISFGKSKTNFPNQQMSLPVSTFWPKTSFQGGGAFADVKSQQTKTGEKTSFATPDFEGIEFRDFTRLQTS